MKTQILGKEGELQAKKFLEQHGIEVLEQNYRTKTGEIDFICRDKQEIVFVEVKSRMTGAFGEGSEAVNGRKQDKMIKTALFYLQSNRWDERPYRFDVISILINSNQINHIRNAFP